MHANMHARLSAYFIETVHFLSESTFLLEEVALWQASSTFTMGTSETHRLVKEFNEKYCWELNSRGCMKSAHG